MAKRFRRPFLEIFSFICEIKRTPPIPSISGSHFSNYLLPDGIKGLLKFSVFLFFSFSFFSNEILVIFFCLIVREMKKKKKKSGAFNSISSNAHYTLSKTVIIITKKRLLCTCSKFFLRICFCFFFPVPLMILMEKKNLLTIKFLWNWKWWRRKAFFYLSISRHIWRISIFNGENVSTSS